jgi:hypothetical protein
MVNLIQNFLFQLLRIIFYVIIPAIKYVIPAAPRTGSGEDLESITLRNCWILAFAE